MKLAVAAALAAASLEVLSANPAYAPCKRDNGITVAQDASCEERIRVHQSKQQAEHLEAGRKEAEEGRLRNLAEPERVRQLEQRRQESHRVLKECLRFASCRLNQYKYHLTRVTRSDVEALLGNAMATHNVRGTSYRYYKVAAEGRRAILQLEIVGSHVAGVNVAW